MTVKLVEESEKQNTPSELDDLTDDLNAMIDLIEAALVRKYNIPARVQFENANSYLVYSKAGNKWGLYFYVDHPGLPLKSASRETRIEAIKLLPQLKKELDEIHASSVIKVRSAIEAAEAFLEDL